MREMLRKIPAVAFALARAPFAERLEGITRKLNQSLGSGVAIG